MDHRAGGEAKQGHRHSVWERSSPMPVLFVPRNKTSKQPSPRPTDLEHIPKEPLPAGSKDSKINANKLETVISKKVQFSSVLEEEDRTANCRFGRTHLSPFSMLIPPL